MAVKRAKGERSGKIPYGLALAEEGHHLVEDGFEQSVIARAKALRAEGHAITRITKALDVLGLRTRTGRPWHPQQIARMLKLVPPPRRGAGHHLAGGRQRGVLFKASDRAPAPAGVQRGSLSISISLLM